MEEDPVGGSSDCPAAGLPSVAQVASEVVGTRVAEYSWPAPIALGRRYSRAVTRPRECSILVARRSFSACRAVVPSSLRPMAENLGSWLGETPQDAYRDAARDLHGGGAKSAAILFGVLILVVVVIIVVGHLI